MTLMLHSMRSSSGAVFAAELLPHTPERQSTCLAGATHHTRSAARHSVRGFGSRPPLPMPRDPGGGGAPAGGGASGWRGWAAAAIAPCQRGRPFNMMLHNNTWYPWHLFNTGKAAPCPPLPSGLAIHRTQRSLLSFLFGLFQWSTVAVIDTGGLELCSLCTLCTVEAAGGACGGPGSSTTHRLGCPKAPLRPARCQRALPGPLHARHLCIDMPPSLIHYPQPSSVAANPSPLDVRSGVYGRLMLPPPPATPAPPGPAGRQTRCGPTIQALWATA